MCVCVCVCVTCGTTEEVEPEERWPPCSELACPVPTCTAPTHASFPHGSVWGVFRFAGPAGRDVGLSRCWLCGVPQ